MRIEINGADYKEAFSSAKELIESGLIRGSIDCAVLSDGSIKHGDDTFVFVEQMEEYAAQQSRMIMTSDGASWFESIRRRARGEITVRRSGSNSLRLSPTLTTRDISSPPSAKPTTRTVRRSSTNTRATHRTS